MKYYYKYVTLLLSLAMAFVSYAQDPENIKQYEDRLQVSPQVWQFATYGSKEQQLYTGTVNLDIPIYTYQDPDFEIPITLSYASNGYKPNQQAGTSGLGWALKAGGYITRRVVGLRDDMDAVTYAGYYKRHLYGVNPRENGVRLFDYRVEHKDVINYMSDFISLVLDENGDPARDEAKNPVCSETTPDQFSFNFMGHQGQFSFDAPKKVAVYNTNHPYGEYKVEFLSVVNFWYNQKNSCFRITTGDGYVYTFDRPTMMGDCAIMDPSCTWSHDIFLDYSVSRLYWPLTEIKAPNGRKVTFEYGDQEYNINLQWHSPMFNDAPYSIERYAILATSEIVQQLKRIKVDDLEIEFEYLARTKEKYSVVNFSDTLKTSPRKLIGIKVRDVKKESIIKSASFDYKYGKGNPVLLLSKLNISGEGDYSFDYYGLEHRFPNQGTMDLDHWGYYNIANLSNNIKYWKDGELDYARPQAQLDSLNRQILLSTNRDSRFNASRIGMLRKVTYPTGGYTTFMYEPHKYQCKVTRDMTHQNNPYALDLLAEEDAGGVRIAQIKDYTTPTNFTTRTFYYNRAGAKGNPGKCSGILLHSPRYFMWHKQAGRAEYLNCIPYPNDRYHIGYSEVMEKFSDGSYNVYNFTNYKSDPDIGYNSSFENVTSAYDGSGGSPNPDENRNLQAEPYSHYLERGKLASLKQFSADNTLRYQEQNYWDTSKPLRYIPCIKRTKFWFYKYKEYVETRPLVAKEITNYSENGTDKTRHIYSYNQLGQLTSEIISRGGRTIRGYMKVYPADLADTSTIASVMCINNLSAKLLYEYETNSLSQIIKAKKYHYMKVPFLGGNILLTGFYELKSSAVPIKNLKDGEFSLTFAFLYSLRNNRLVEMIDKNGVSTSYLWGYGDLYPVAVGKNILFGNNVQEPVDGTLIESEEKRLRQLPDAELTTYKYIPYVGISKETNSRGESTTYEYNRHGKLRAVYKSLNPICSYTYSTDNK